MSRMPMSRQGAGLLGWLLLAFSAAAIGAVASVDAATFYAGLLRPHWAPPGWLFGPVWGVLYLLMGVAAWLVWRQQGLRLAATALGLFIAQLAINALWSWLFFAWHLGALACVDIVVLWLLIIAMLRAFWRVRALAALLLLPYLAWVSFAALLCYATWQLNPQMLS
ncbi:MAG: tryptophan-rich sensory protein [Rhodanobacter sp.]|nr:MAG: tryptophan-rich sensory protein [Rhodanobacter sp.]